LVVKHPFAREGNLVRRDPVSGFVSVYSAGMTIPMGHPNDLHNEANLTGFSGSTTWWSIVRGSSCHIKFIHSGPDCPRIRDVEGRVSSLPVQSEEAYQFLFPFARVKRDNQLDDVDHGNLRVLEHNAPLWYGGSTPPWYRE